MLGPAAGHEAREGSQCAQTVVAGLGRAMPVASEMAAELPHQVGADVHDDEAFRRLAQTLR